MIAMICASPKAKGSTAEKILYILKEKIADTKIFKLNGDIPKRKTLDEVMLCDKLIFSFPLYVDGIPSHLLRWMEIIAQREYTISRKVYCIINCGFYEGEHSNIALEMMKNFCRQCRFEYCGGIGIGSGGLVPYVRKIPLNIGAKKKLYSALEVVYKAAVKGEVFSDEYISMGLSARVYKEVAKYAFRINAKKNGVRI